MFHYFVFCVVDFEIVENVNECYVAQTKVVNDEVIDVGWECNFQKQESFLALYVKQTTVFPLAIL